MIAYTMTYFQTFVTPSFISRNIFSSIRFRDQVTNLWLRLQNIQRGCCEFDFLTSCDKLSGNFFLFWIIYRGNFFFQSWRSVNFNQKNTFLSIYSLNLLSLLIFSLTSISSWKACKLFWLLKRSSQSAAKL